VKGFDEAPPLRALLTGIGQRIFHFLAKPLVTEGGAAATDNGEGFRQPVVAVEIEKGRHQFARGQVARGPGDYDGTRLAACGQAALVLGQFHVRSPDLDDRLQPVFAGLLFFAHRLSLTPAHRSAALLPPS
jgi:hypothetical protein